MSTRKSLGRNLSALLGPSAQLTVNSSYSTEHRQLALNTLQPGKYQPRSDMDEQSLQDLAHSIKEKGVLQPLLVRELCNGRFEIIAGERRFRASQIAGLHEVPVVLKQVDDETAMAMALIENLQREDLNTMDQARAMHRLTAEFKLTHQQVADLVSKSRASVSNLLRLLSLSDEVKKLLETKQLDMGHARALLGLNEEQQAQIAKLIVQKNLSVRETEQLVLRINSGSPVEKSTATLVLSTIVQERLRLLEQSLGLPIKLKQGARAALIIQYTEDNGLQQMMDRLES
jgi:ParB family chromosome partitioning protein